MLILYTIQIDSSNDLSGGTNPCNDMVKRTVTVKCELIQSISNIYNCTSTLGFCLVIACWPYGHSTKYGHHGCTISDYFLKKRFVNDFKMQIQCRQQQVDGTVSSSLINNQ